MWNSSRRIRRTHNRALCMETIFYIHDHCKSCDRMGNPRYNLWHFAICSQELHVLSRALPASICTFTCHPRFLGLHSSLHTPLYIQGMGRYQLQESSVLLFPTTHLTGLIFRFHVFGSQVCCTWWLDSFHGILSMRNNVLNGRRRYGMTKTRNLSLLLI